ncbi:MAG: tRNA (N(6)-L-threonylcarbamoyladenosine(37)-C(2))-methylthiotransferase MtaB [Chitinophagales bacterium]|nr:tRNA (N(6)-L-threonylcarbamoyladenosine(37)-C(2))-methylthiotransferase MtaB [Chitinophagales bacterium]MCO5247672.1 tRNA (N(6)-L-threonylcarbamoyladenosine(37)-C(2))-methylthiotransferase MtaB [Chitinophagales bacterium]MCZ2394427.1 tRNA (N(6)-L-threonylcarbamoyladenosine(37)-C(2))-methylthiotransferase MtaB [Chitinophagales bacterium]
MNSGKTVAFYTLGCKLNFSETSAIGRSMESAGFQIVDYDSPSDVYVINTCSVTDNADKKCRYYVRKALRNNPDAYVVVIGCYAQLKPNEIVEIKGVDLVLGAAEKFRLPEILHDLSKNACGQVIASNIKAADFFVSAYSVGDRTRSFLKVQDGCDYKCSFCTIPLARGQSRSDLPENVIANVKDLASKGVKEIVLTGVNTGDYGKGLDDEWNFLKLIQELDEIEGIERFRISSIEPNLLSNEIIEFCAQSKRFVPHFHMPLQSGSDEMLASMRRRYKKDLYANRVSYIRQLMPDACIGVDVIVGFAGESDEYFEETVAFLKSMDVSYFHVFTFSERANTKALELDNVVPQKVREERNARLSILSEKKRREFYQRFIGKTMTILPEDENKNGLMYGFTDNYLKVAIPYDEQLVNQLVKVELLGFTEDGYLEGKVLVSQLAM